MYKYTIDTASNVIRIEFEGEISLEEYRRLLTELVESPDFQRSPTMLIDQRRGRLAVSMEEARSQPSFILGLQDHLGEPKIACVTSTDYDYGMNRMFELSSEDILNHTGKVFRDMDEACEWLGLSGGDQE